MTQFLHRLSLCRNSLVVVKRALNQVRDVLLCGMHKLVMEEINLNEHGPSFFTLNYQ